MASPSIAEAHTQLKNAVDLYHEIAAFCEGTHAAAAGTEDTLVQSLETDYAPEVTAAAAQIRAALNAALSQGRNLGEAVLRTYAKIIGAPETDVDGLLTRLYDYFADNSITVQSRGFSYGAPTAGGGNVGNGAINRLTVDARGYAIESGFADARTAICVADRSNGRLEHEEQFEVRGGTPGRDLLSIAGSGIVYPAVPAISARTTPLLNPSFSKYSGTAAVPTSITDWTPGSSIANFEVDETNYYRDFPGDQLQAGTAGSASLKIKGNDSLAQALSVRGETFDPRVPYYLQIAWNRQVGTGDGTLSIGLGDESSSVVLAAQTGWQILRLALGTKCWQRNWNTTDPAVTITLASRTTGYVLVDDVILTPMQPFDSDWIAIVGGSTPFLINDTFTWTDTIASDSKVQRMIARTFRRYLPHAGSPSVTDP